MFENGLDFRLELVAVNSFFLIIPALQNCALEHLRTKNWVGPFLLLVPLRLFIDTQAVQARRIRFLAEKKSPNTAIAFGRMTTERIAVCLKSFDGSVCTCLRSGFVHSVCAKPDLPRFRAGYTKGRTSNSRQQQTIFLQQIHELCSKRSLESRESRDDV
jgi:hypothetical protein